MNNQSDDLLCGGVRRSAVVVIVLFFATPLHQLVRRIRSGSSSWNDHQRVLNAVMRLEHVSKVHHGDEWKVMRPGESWSKNGRVRIEVVSSCGSGQPRMNHVVMSGRMLDTLRPQDGRSSGRRRCFAYEPGDGEVA